MKANHPQEQIRHIPLPHSASDHVNPPVAPSPKLHAPVGTSVATPKFESHLSSTDNPNESQFVTPVPSSAPHQTVVSEFQPTVRIPPASDAPKNIHFSAKKKSSSTEDSKFDEREPSPQRQSSDTDSMPSRRPNVNSSDEKLTTKTTAKEQPSQAQNSGSERQNLESLDVLKTQAIQKPRKPYTITKSREVWTKDEHARFLSALQMYDRDWKKIELYIGTKTVLQIRSHAQKHFGKVAKYKTGEYIPPPRPKKRAALPYPRSCPTTPTKAAAVAAAESADRDQSILEEATAEPRFKRGATSDSSSPGNSARVLRTGKATPKKEGKFHKQAGVTKSQTQREFPAVYGKGKSHSSNLVSMEASQEAITGNPSDGKGNNSHVSKLGVTENCCRASHRIRSVGKPEADYESLNCHHPKSDKRREKSVSEDRSSCGKRTSTPSHEGAPSPKRQTLGVSHGPNISRVSIEIKERRDSDDDVNIGLQEANNSLLVLSDCVDMMSRNDKTENGTAQNKWQASAQSVGRTKIARARSSSVITSIDENEGEGYLNTLETKTGTQVNVRAVIHSTREEQTSHLVERRNQQREHATGDGRTGSPPAEAEDRNNGNLSGDPQRSSVGSGSASDDPMAGLTCSDRPSVSDNGLGSSYTGSGSRGSVDSSQSAEGEEDPKSSNEGSGDDGIRQAVSSRDSSPADPNSSVSREVSPNSNSSTGGEGSRPQGNVRGLKPNEQKGAPEKASSMGICRKTSKGLNGDETSRQKTLQNGRNVPISKTIAHLINNLEELECPLAFKRNLQSRHENGMETGFREPVRLDCGEATDRDEGVARNNSVSKRWLSPKQKEAIDG